MPNQEYESGHPYQRSISQHSANSRILNASHSAYPPYLLNTNLSNIGPSAHHTTSPVDEKMTYFIFRSLKLKKSSMAGVMTFLLVASLIMERYCFIVTVYKTKYYGYVLILIAIFMNCMFNFLLSRLKKKKQKKRLHELFNIERTPSVGWFIIGIIG